MKRKENFKLNEGQKLLKDKFEKFLDSSERLFLLTGKPGVGKTYMVKFGFSELINADIEGQLSGSQINVAGIALAHQAKNVLGEHIPNVFTFAKAYGLKEKLYDDGSRGFEYDKNQEDFPIGQEPIPVFIHDEVSQYTTEMLRIVLEKTPIFSKIVLIGDACQLPPIDPNGEMPRNADSPVFDLELPDDCKHELTERVRQTKGNPILDLTDIIREEILGSHNIVRVLNCLRTANMVKGKGYDLIGYPELNKHLEGKNQLDTCVIAFRNKTVDYFNDSIRNYLLGDPVEDIIKGDIICMKDNFYKRLSDGSIGYVLHNSDTFEIEKVYKRNLRFVLKGKHKKIECYIGKIVGKTLEEVVVPTSKGMIAYDSILEELLKECKSYKIPWKEFWDFKKMFCNCSYGYAITTYKVQGSSYNNVYLDVNDVLLTKPLTSKRKLQTIYTAITRARSSVYILKKRV